MPITMKPKKYRDALGSEKSRTYALDRGKKATLPGDDGAETTTREQKRKVRRGQGASTIRTITKDSRTSPKYTGQDAYLSMQLKKIDEEYNPEGRQALKKGGKAKKSKSRVNEAGNYTKPGMRKRLFNRIKAGGKGGRPGQWSARKAQMLASAYKKAGGGYKN
jgi:hypothetical protein